MIMTPPPAPPRKERGVGIGGRLAAPELIRGCGEPRTPTAWPGRGKFSVESGEFRVERS